MRFPLIRLGLAALIVGTLAGCGGGGGGGTSDGTTAGAAAASGGPAGTAVVTAAAANPAATNTAQNPDQAFGLIVTAGASPVVVQSPPKMYFSVIDSTGKHVPGLKLFGSAPDPYGNCGTTNQSNVSALISKLVPSSDGNSPSVWQNLISRQRYATDDLTARYSASDTAKLYPSYRYAVAEGTTDPKPATGYTNPATALTDPSTRIVGILEEEADEGYYTYHFATDVTTPLLFADAVDKKNVSLGKVANNGNLAVKDGKTVHRVALQLCYTDPVTKAKVVVNPTFDFTLGADGVAVPVKASDGKTLTEGKKVVDIASCNECHSKLAIHGGNRVETKLCVVCHNPGSTDYNSNNSVDLKYMVHKIHMGKELTKDYKVASLRVKFTDKNGAITGTAFPQDVKNCTKCHDGSATATHKTAQGDNWKNVPSRAACGACHDGIDFATGAGVTLAGALVGETSDIGHVGGSKKDDTQCVLCHDSATIPVYHVSVTTVPARNYLDALTGAVSTQVAGQKNLPAGAAKFTYEIKSGGVTVSGTPQRASVAFRILKDGAPVTFNTYAAGATALITGFTGGPSIYIVFAVPQDGITAPADFNASYSCSVQNVWNGTCGTLSAPDADGYYTATIGDTTTAYDIPTDAVMVTAGLLSGSFTQTSVSGYSKGLVLPAPAVQQVASGYTARRPIVDNAKCNVCHEQLGTAPYFHSGARNNGTVCAFCHTPNRTSSGWSADSTTFIHGIHGSSKRTYPFTWHTDSYRTSDGKDHFKNIGYPGVLKTCETCHLPGTYDFSATASAAQVSSRLYRYAATGVFNGNVGTVTLARTFDANGVQTNGGSTSTIPVTQGAVDSISPYVTKDNATDYGLGFAYTAYRAAAAAKAAVAYAAATATTAAKGSIATPAVVAGASLGTRVAAASNLVHSPIAAACFSCHDSDTAKSHMSNDGGGSIYATRTAALARTETCLMCHGTGKLVDIKAMHAK